MDTCLLISAQERSFVVNGVEEGVRNDGRGPFDYRPIHVESGVLPSANGSARVQIANATDVLVGVKAELSTVESAEECPNNRLNFFVDFSAVASPEFAGRGGNDLGEELAGTFYSAYDNADVLPDLNGKCIVSPFHTWSLYVDVVVLRCDGNVVDAISLGVKAALANTEICEVVAIPADADKVMIELPDEITTWKLDVSRAPLVIAVNEIGSREVIDASEMEEASSSARLLVGVSIPTPSDGTTSQHSAHTSTGTSITCVKKLGGGSLDLQSLQSMIDVAQMVAVDLDAALVQWLNAEEAEMIEAGGNPFEASRTFLK